jgi:phosphatidylglycerol---prolipoprotein diacylglyceryl transferase
MHRHLFDVESYGVFQIAALVLFAVLAAILLQRSSIRLRHAAGLTLLYVLCNFVASKLLYDFVKAKGQHTLFDHPAIAHFLEGGYWGWPIAFFPCAVAYPLLFRINPVTFYRAVSFLLPPVFALQKIACFMAGCCFGSETAVPWAITFPDDSLCELPGIPVHPVQLYDTMLPLGILVILIGVDRKCGQTAQPYLLPLMIGLYAVSRFATEFFRPRIEGETLLVSQWLELAAVFGAVLLLTFGKRGWRRLCRIESVGSAAAGGS